MIRIDFLSAKVFAANMLGSAGLLALDAYARYTGRRDNSAPGWHPSTGERTEDAPAPTPPFEPRPFTEDELDDAHFVHVIDQARCFMWELGLYMQPLSAVVDEDACEAMWALNYEGAADD